MALAAGVTALIVCHTHHGGGNFIREKLLRDSRITYLTINGQSVGEIGIKTCFAGHWDFPFIFVQGDEAACYGARMRFPGVVIAAADTCVGLDPESARRETATRIAEAITKLKTGEPRPYKPALPMTITLRMRTVEGRVGSQAEVVKWLLGAAWTWRHEDIPRRAFGFDVNS